MQKPKRSQVKKSIQQKNMRGVTLLELVVVIAIVGIFTSVSAVTYNSTEKQRKVTLAAQQIQADLRYVQNLALSFKKHNGRFARGGYGIRFLNNASSYTIFADLSCEGASDCVPPVPGPLFANGGQGAPFNSLNDADVNWSLDKWTGGNVFIRSGKCGGNLRFVETSDFQNVYANKPFTNSDGTNCIPDTTSEYMVFGNAQFDSGAGERVEDKRADGVQIVVPSATYDLVFTPPRPEVKSNQFLISGAARITITISAGGFTKFVDVYGNGFIEIRNP